MARSKAPLTEIRRDRTGRGEALHSLSMNQATAQSGSHPKAGEVQRTKAQCLSFPSVAVWGSLWHLLQGGGCFLLLLLLLTSCSLPVLPDTCSLPVPVSGQPWNGVKGEYVVRPVVLGSLGVPPSLRLSFLSYKMGPLD